jgi:tRNA-dependent cyclodipeptide synthase
MRIETYLNCTSEEIKSKKFNIFVGISLGNKYFSKDHLEKYILWALENTKKDVAILIADINHAINYEVFNGLSPKKAIGKALRKGLEVETILKEIIETLPKNKQSLVKIAKWDALRNSQIYKKLFPIILDEFKNNTLFYDTIQKIIQESLKERVIGLEKNKLDKVAMYVLDELPILLCGFEFDGRIYDLHPYPGSSSLDDLWMNIREKKIFPNIAEKITSTNKIAQVEAYVD